MLPYVGIAFRESLGGFMCDHKPGLTLSKYVRSPMTFLSMLHVFTGIVMCDCVFESISHDFMINFNSNM